MDERLEEVDETIKLLVGIVSGKLYKDESFGSRDSRPPAPDLTVPLALRVRDGGGNAARPQVRIDPV